MGRPRHVCASEGLAFCDRRVVADELEQRAVWVAKVKTHSSTVYAVSLNRPEFDLDTVLPKVLSGILNRAGICETEVAISWHNRNFGQRRRAQPRAMDIELNGAELVSPTGATAHDFSAKHLFVKLVGLVPIGDVNDGVV